MGLQSRIERLENRAGMRDKPLPNIIVTFTEPTRDAEGRMRPGRTTGGLRLLSRGRRQWLDGDLNPVGPVMEYADFGPMPG